MQGTVRKASISLKLGFSSEAYGYAIDLGLPIPGGLFGRDPVIKTETLWTGLVLQRANAFAERLGPFGHPARSQGAAPAGLYAPPGRSTACSPIAPIPRMAPSCCRCASNCATGVSMTTSAPTSTHRPAAGRSARARRYSPATVPISPPPSRPSRRSGSRAQLEAAVADAFPGGSVDVAVSDGYFEVEMLQHGLLRPSEGDGAVGRNAALSPAGGGAVVAAAAVADDPERARDQPASRPAGAARAPHRERGEAIAGDRGVTCRTPRLRR